MTETKKRTIPREACVPLWQLCRYPGCKKPRRQVQAAKYCTEHATSINYKQGMGMTVRLATCEFCSNPYVKEKSTAKLDLCPSCQRTYGSLIRQWRRHQVSWETIHGWLNSGGTCWVCGLSLGLSPGRVRTKIRDVVVDHDHRCHPGDFGCEACIRGLAHAKCNLLLGHLESILDRWGSTRVYEILEELA